MSRDGDVNSGTKREVGGQDLCERENDTNRKDMADTGRHAGARARRWDPPAAARGSRAGPPPPITHGFPLNTRV